MIKSVVLLSAGLDSTTNLFLSHKKEKVILTLTFNYGQKAAVKEIESAQKLSSFLGIPNKVVRLPFFSEFQASSLIQKDQAIPTGTEIQMDDKNQSLKTAKSVWVPNRNGIFLNIAAGFAEALGVQKIIPGFNLEEAQTFPDNTADFMKATTTALTYSTVNKVQVECYTVQWDKTQIAKEAKKLNVPFDLMWPCYFAKEKWCGECESCQRSKRALKNADIAFDTLFM